MYDFLSCSVSDYSGRDIFQFNVIFLAFGPLTLNCVLHFSRYTSNLAADTSLNLKSTKKGAQIGIGLNS